jgi:hypothetical protein
MTLSAVITPITENTPIVTPRIVNTERNLFVRNAMSERRKISEKDIFQLAVGGWRLAAGRRELARRREAPK